MLALLMDDRRAQAKRLRGMAVHSLLVGGGDQYHKTAVANCRMSAAATISAIVVRSENVSHAVTHPTVWATQSYGVASLGNRQSHATNWSPIFSVPNTLFV